MQSSNFQVYVKNARSEQMILIRVLTWSENSKEDAEHKARMWNLNNAHLFTYFVKILDKKVIQNSIHPKANNYEFFFEASDRSKSEGEWLKTQYILEAFLKLLCRFKNFLRHYILLSPEMITHKTGYSLSTSE